MSDRFLVFVNGGDGAALIPEAWHAILAKHGLNLMFEGKGLRGYVSSDCPTLILPERGIIIGTVFDRQSGHRLDAPSLDRGREHADLPRWLITHVWGRYVAFIEQPTDSSIDVLRDPAGFIPCYMARWHGWSIYSDDCRLLHRLGAVTSKIDWPAVARSVAQPGFRGRETGIVGISEPMPGERIRVSHGRSDLQSLWSPARFSRTGAAADFDANVETIRHVVTGCVEAWSRNFEHLLLSLSGGLDSSILAASVPNAVQRLVGLTLVSGTGRGDESRFAFALAQAIGFPLMTHKIDASHVDIEQSLASGQPRPSAHAFTQPIDAILRGEADAHGIEVHLNGGGGDSVFGFLHSANPAADRLKSEGFGPGFLRTVLNLASITQCTPWHVGRRALAKTIRGRQELAWPTDTSFLKPSAVAALHDRPSHPWLETAAGLLPGQREHIISIMRALGSVHALNIADRRPTIYPLLSQPVIEACLAIPTWHQCRGGRDRAVARAAFECDLPEMVSHRRMKGTFDALTSAILQSNKSRITEMLLDGRLARQGFLDRDALRAAIEKSTVSGQRHGRILQLVDVEAWATAWEGSATAL